MRDAPDFAWMCEKERQAAIYFNGDYSIPKKTGLWKYLDGPVEDITIQPTEKDEDYILSCARMDLIQECNRLKYDIDMTTTMHVKKMFHNCTAEELDRCTMKLKRK